MAGPILKQIPVSIQNENAMIIHPLPKQSRQKRVNRFAIALVALFAIATFWLTHPETPAQPFSAVSGLMTLSAAAQEALPYPVALANQKPTLIEFYADWCTTCQALAPTLQALQHQFGDQVNFVMLNIDDPHWQEQVQQFRVTGVPHLTLLEADQTLADTLVGKVPQLILADRLTALLG